MKAKPEKKLTKKEKEAKKKYMRDYMLGYYKKNRDKMIEKQKDWNVKNKKKVNDYQRKHPFVTPDLANLFERDIEDIF